MPIYNVDLLEYIINIPDFDGTIDRGGYDTIPISDDQSFQLYDPAEVSVEDFHEFARLQIPDV